MTPDTLIVLVVVAAAVAFIVRRGVMAARRTGCCSCSCGCSASKAGTCCQGGRAHHS